MRGGRALVIAGLLALIGSACAGALPAAEPTTPAPPQFAVLPDRIVLRNDDGLWTVRTRCHTRGRLTVGPGYISRLVTHDRVTIVDDHRRRGTLNDPRFGGLGAFGWHHARGQPGRLQFRDRNAWEVSGRICARANHGFGVARTAVVDAPHLTADGEVELALDVFFSDMYTYPRPLLAVRYRYRVGASVVRSWIDVRPLCGRGRCGVTPALAFVKEPKLVAHVSGGDYTRMATFGEGEDLQCLYAGGGSLEGPIYDTGQCAHDSRSRLRFDYGTPTSGADGDCEGRPCLDVVMRASSPDAVPGDATRRWEGAGLGLDAWALSAARRPAAFRRDTPSIDGVVWPCHGSTPADADVRRWETTGRRDALGRYRTLGGLFPGWEGGRGGYDCEPLARAFGPAWEQWRVFASYSLGTGWTLR